MKMRMTLTLACCLLASVATAQTATDLTCTSCVGETDIANQAVTGAKIANGTITATDIRLSTITSDRIKNHTLVLADLAPKLQDYIGGAIANFTVQRVSASATSVVGAACPSDRIPVGASCECDDANGARNIGVLFGCTVTGTGAAAGCFDEAATFNPTLPEPLAIVRAVCLGAESVDGTPWVPTSAGLVVDRSVSESAAAEQARWMKEQHDSFESVLARFRDQRATFESRRAAIAK
jgi:hypothetical protein